jgi:hypothetical protein
MRNFKVCIYLVKAAELEVIRRTTRELLRGLKFTTIYTPHFAMCTDSLSEILLGTSTEPVETKSVMRFSCSGLFPKQELKAMRAHMDELCRHRRETVGMWYEHEPNYFDKAAAKANQSVQKTLKEIGRKPGESFNIMIINNDILPMLELVAPGDYNQLETARPGDVLQFRYEVAIGFRSIMNWQLVHAYHYT